MNNLQKWRFYLKDVCSPEDYIETSFYSMINIALSRRVFLMMEGQPVFPNTYVILVGDPGVGKGRVISPMLDILRQHKYSVFRKSQMSELEYELMQNREIQKRILEQSRDLGLIHNDPSRTSVVKDDLLFPIAPDATTFENLVFAHANCTRSIKTAQCELAPTGVYVYNGLAFVLEELSSLFRKKQESLVNYLIKVYDGNQYTYEVRSREMDRIEKTCLNLFGGTQPSFIQELYADRLINEGFASRTIFVHAEENRFHKLKIGGYSAEQLQVKNALVEHIGQLGRLFGEVTLTHGAFEYLRKVVEETIPIQLKESNDQLRPYFARKKIHLVKYAIAAHFADSLDFALREEDFRIADDLLGRLEKGMATALKTKPVNLISSLGDKILRMIRRRKRVDFVTIWRTHVDQATLHELREALIMLQGTHKIQKVKDSNGKEFYEEKSPV